MTTARALQEDLRQDLLRQDPSLHLLTGMLPGFPLQFHPCRRTAALNVLHGTT